MYPIWNTSMIITSTLYAVLPLFATRFVACSGGIWVIFLMGRGRAPNGIGHLIILKLQSPELNCTFTNILFTFLMDRRHAPNGIGHLMIQPPKGWSLLVHTHI